MDEDEVERAETFPVEGSRALSERLGIGPGTRVAVLHAPEGFDDLLGPVPDGADVRHGLKRSDSVDLILGFVPSRSHLARNVDWLVATIRPSGAFWVLWPTGRSGLETDLSEGAIHEVAQPLGWVGTDVITVGPDWSALRLAAQPSSS
ncbi:MAG TPA: DUF3052 domain-containing protein [Acidimicrobiales bacterium]|nr:DUF3052 domain-containing protein [Acidimicrobiales bacterium]